MIYHIWDDFKNDSNKISFKRKENQIIIILIIFNLFAYHNILKIKYFDHNTKIFIKFKWNKQQKKRKSNNEKSFKN
jgi:hypothetical protein